MLIMQDLIVILMYVFLNNLSMHYTVIALESKNVFLGVKETLFSQTWNILNI